MSRPLTLLVTTLTLAILACGPGAPEPVGTPIEATRLAERIVAGSAPLILDVRSREEFARGRVPGAQNIPHDELASRLAELPADRSAGIVVHCQSGGRAAVAERTLRENGFSNVRPLAGHWQGWREAKLPVE